MRELNSNEAFQDFESVRTKILQRNLFIEIILQYQKFSKILMKKIKIHLISF